MSKMRPILSASAWQAAHGAAARSIPRLIARGHVKFAADLARRSKQFEVFAADGTSALISKGQDEQAPASPSHPSREQKGSEK